MTDDEKYYTCAECDKKMKELDQKIEKIINEGINTLAEDSILERISALEKYYNIKNEIGMTDHEWKTRIIDRIIDTEQQLSELSKWKDKL